MRKTRDILRLKWSLGRTHREIARALGVGAGTVSDTATRARDAGLDWEGVEALGDDELEAKLYPRPATAPGPRPEPDPAQIDVELRRKEVTLRLLHLEYLEQHPGGIGYTQFCDRYRAWLRDRQLTMRQVHRAGDKMFVDYAGRRPTVTDPKTGDRVAVELFVAVLGASNYTYAEATRSQTVPDWIESHVRALEFFGGAPAAFVPDQLKSAVTRAGRYEPGVQRTYEELAEHYGAAVIPARPAHPRDKAKVEVAVQIAERWILARLRHQTFFSLDALNERIAELLVDLNARVMRRYKASRCELFERLDRPELRALPAARFVYGEWKRARVHVDYHVAYDDHFYSVPYQLVGDEVWLRATSLTVEAFHKSQRVASHVRSYERGRHTTDDAHRAVRHQQHAAWTPERMVRWASTIGDNAAALVERILTERRHPEHGYRSCLGIIRLEKKYGRERLEAACGRALAAGGRSYTHVDAILRHGLDRVSVAGVEADASVGDHENVRGPDYYH
jgi:transposase